MSNSNSSEAYRKKIEKDILFVIKEKLLSLQMKAPKARSIARYILETLKPHMTREEIFQVAQNFDEHFQELAPIEKEVRIEHEEQIKSKISTKLAELIKEKRVDEASNIISQLPKQ